MKPSSKRSDPWFRRFHPASDATARLVCLPHAGGSASFFFPMSQALSPSVEVLAVQYPGRQDRRQEQCVESITELADAVSEGLFSWSDRPLALFGHSMGALLAFEITGRLEQRGIVPLSLFVSGRRAPSSYRAESVHLRDDDGLIAELIALSGTDSQVLGDDEILRMALPAIRSDYKAVETYHWEPGSPVRTPLHVHVGDSDSRVTAEEARMWERHSAGIFTLTTYSGGHFYLNQHADKLVENIAHTISGGLPAQSPHHTT